MWRFAGSFHLLRAWQGYGVFRIADFKKRSGMSNSRHFEEGDWKFLLTFRETEVPASK